MDIKPTAVWGLAKVLTGSRAKGAQVTATAKVSRIDNDGKIWVNVKGSPIDTPVNGGSRVDVSKDDTVEVTISGGRCVITGNADNPSAGMGAVGTLNDKAALFASNFVTINNLVAQKATVEELEATTARVSELEATTAVIGTLEAGYAIIEDLDVEALNAATAFVSALEADEVTAGTLSAATAYIEELAAGDITAEDIAASTATIKRLDADELTAAVAYVSVLTASNLTAGDVLANSINVMTLDADSLTAAVGYIGDLISGNITAQKIIADSGTIDSLDSTYARIVVLDTGDAYISNAYIDHAMVDGLSANYAHLDTTVAGKAVIDNATISQADVRDLAAHYAQIEMLQSGEARITNAHIDQANVDGLYANYAHLDTTVAGNAVIDNATISHANVDGLSANYASISLANVNNAYFENGVFKTSQVVDEQVFTVTGNKATITRIDAEKILVQNLKADNITVKKINGQTVTGKSVADALEAHEGDISGLGEDLDDLSEWLDDELGSLNRRVDSQIETFTTSVVPLSVNYPASDWDTDEVRSSHVGDICYVVNSQSEADGFTYRYAYDSTNDTYGWVLIRDNQVTDAIQRLIDAEESIEGLEEFESDTSVWIENTDEGMQTLMRNHTSLSGRVDNTIVSTAQLWYIKADTTAPAPPTAHVTQSSASVKNAWTTVVPQYDATARNYFYCYEWQYANDTYGWSAVTRDIAMGEAQVNSRAAISGVDVEYADSTSMVTAPTSGWATTAPAWQAGHYIWQRTKTTTPNGSTYSTPTCISGRDGVDGTSVSVASVTYATSASESQPTTGWSASVPTSVPEGSWLWVKTTYTDGTDAVVRARQGVSGSSVTVSSTTYQSGSSATTAPTGSWSSTPVAVGEGGYLWTKVTYSDGSTSYSVAKQGVSAEALTVTSTTLSYILSTSGTTVPTGSWSTTPLAPTTTQYLWTRSVNTYSDGSTSTSYSVGGKTGTSVTVSSVQYGTSANASTAPSSWSGTAPTSIAKGSWLWVKTTYSDSSTTTTKSYVGTDGEDGKSVYVQSSTKTGDTTTVVLTDGTNSTTLTIRDGEDGDTGSDGANGYVHVAWSTAADGSTGFSTSSSTNKTYLGVYTDNVAPDSNNPSDYSWSLIKGNKGDKGDKGETGKGIASVTEYYALNNSTTPPADSAFSTTVRTPTESNRYVWNYELITYTDGSTEAMAKHVAATYGQTGAAGKGISSIEERYATSNSTTAPSDSAFSTTLTNPTLSSRYLWNYEVITYTDSTTSRTDKRIIGAYGETGKGVSAIEEQYYLSTSNTAQTGGSWSATQPEWESGKYLWTRSRVTWTDSTTTTTDPVLASAVNSANETASDAQEAAENSVRSAIQLWYAKADTTAPSKPTTRVTTANAATANAWNTVMPRYQSANPHYFYCWQYEKMSGGYTWSDVVYDAATSDNQRMTATAIEGLEILVDSSTTTDLVNEVGEYARTMRNVATMTETAYESSVEYIEGTQASSTSVWTGVTRDSTLRKGKAITFKLPYASTTTAVTLELTLSGGGTTGAKDVLINSDNSANNHVSTHFGNGSVIGMTYDGTSWRVSNYTTGNTYDRTRYNSYILAAEAITAGRIIVGKAIGYRNLAAGVEFDLSYPILYARAAIAKGSQGSNNDINASGINYSSNGTIAGAASNKVVYLTGTVTGNTFKVSSSNFLTCTQPSSEGLFCIPLGVIASNSTTNGSFSSTSQLWSYIAERDAAGQVTGGSFQQSSARVVTNSNTVNAVRQTAAANSSTISNLTNRLGTNADGTESSNDIVAKQSALEQTVDGITTSITSIQNTVETKADGSTVTTLQNSYNNISETVNGHTQSIASVTDTQATMQTTLNGAIKSTVQLWYTKENTTAPAKPTAHVTTNDATTSGKGKWNMAIPAYASTHPHYFYCYEWQYTDGTYGWSAVTRDVAMAESQSTARTASTTAMSAANTANKAMKSSLQLWYTKADSTAPSAPTASTSIVTNAATANQWNKVVPTYNASYPHYFYCYEYTASDGTKTYSGVVYDRATTESQDTARATSSSLASYITSNDLALQSLQNQVDGQIEAWYMTADPTSSNAPASGWATDEERERHVGDLYYNVDNGHSWRWLKSGSSYSWQQIPDSDAAAALAAAQNAQTTANGKRRIFTATPTVPYDKGDLWVNGSEVKYAKSARSSGSYTASDWALTATDDTAANAAQATADKNVREAVQIWYTKANSTAPTTGGISASTGVTVDDPTQGNKWNLVVPVYNASYPCYFYAMQYLLADGTYEFSDVVYDQATTENQANSRTAMSTASAVTTSFNEFVTSDTQFKSSLGETYATKTELSEGYYPSQNVTVATDLDTMRTTGIYHFRVSSNPNAPTTGHGTLTVEWTLGTPYQIWKVDNSSEQYYRKYTSNAFTAWTKLDPAGNASAITTETDRRKAIYGTCSTAAGTAAKVVTCANFQLYTGATVTVVFSNANTAATPTLNVNSTGAIGVRSFDGQALDEGEYKWPASATMTFTYDGTYWRISDSGTLSRVTTAETEIDQNKEAIALRATKSEAINLAQPNLSPFFSRTPYSLAENYWSAWPYSDATADTVYYYTSLGDGWIHIHAQNTSSDAIRRDIACIRNNAIDPDKDYTFLFEIRNNTSSGTNSATDIYIVQRTETQFFGNNVVEVLEATANSINDTRISPIANCPTDGYYFKRFVKKPEQSGTTAITNGDLANALHMVCVTFRCAANTTIDYDFRMSMYEGEYWGPYKPYVGSLLYASQAELKVANDNISSKVSTTDYNGETVASLINQAADSVKIAANHVDIEGAAIFTTGALKKVVVSTQNEWYSSTSTSSLTGGSWSTSQPSMTAGRYIWERQKVTYSDETSEYKPSTQGVCVQAPTNLSSYSTTAQMNTAIGSAVDNISVGGRNLLLHSEPATAAPRAFAPAVYLCAMFDISEYGHLVQGETYTITIEGVNSGRTGLDPYVGGGSLNIGDWASITNVTNVKQSWIFTASASMASASQVIHVYSSSVASGKTQGSTAISGSFTVTRIKLEKGNKATDWSPAPEDQTEYTDNLVELTSTGLGIKWNHSTFTGYNSGEAFLCGWDSSTGQLTDTDGWVYFRGVKRTVAKGMINPNSWMLNRTIYIVLRLSSSAATTGTTYLVTYSSGWKNLSTGIDQSISGATTSTWTWNDDTDVVLGTFMMIDSDTTGMVDCIQYTPVRTSQQVTIGDTAYLKAANAQTTANNAAPKASAVARTQRIYQRTTGTTAPGANTTWLATSGTGYSNWSLKVPPLTSGTTKYPYLWTCVQTQTVTQYADGSGTTCSCSAVLIDDSTTVIDGGNIITGTVTANKLNAADINASGVLTVGSLSSAAQDAMLNSNAMPSKVVGENELVSGPIAELSANGWAEQDSTSGKNLIGGFVGKTANGITFTVNPDGSVTANGTATAVITCDITNITLPAGTYTLSGCPAGGSGNTYQMDCNGAPTGNDYGNGATYTLSETTTIARIRIRIASGITCNNLTFYPQMEAGSAKTAYEPYTGGKPSPSPQYPQEIRMARGRNLAQPNGHMSPNTSGVIAEYSNYDSFYAPVESGQAYVFTGEGIVFAYYTQVPTVGATSYNGSRESRSGTTATSTAPIDGYILIRVNEGARCQLEKGTTPTPYVPYGYVGLEVRGRNLLPNYGYNNTLYGITCTTAEDGTITLNGTCTTNTVLSYRALDTALAADTYTLSAGNMAANSGVSIRLNHNDPTMGVTCANANASVTGAVSGTITNDWCVRVASGTTLNNFKLRPQLEFGSTVTSYEPYRAPTVTPIPLPERGWVGALPDGTHDTLHIDGAGHVTWEMVTGSHVFDGTEPWVATSASGTFAINMSNSTALGIKLPAQGQTLADKLRQNTVPIANMGDFTYKLNDATYIVNRSMTSVAAFTAWLAQNPVTILYPLATPIVEDVGYISMPATNGTVRIPELEGMQLVDVRDDSIASLVSSIDGVHSSLNGYIDDSIEDALESANSYSDQIMSSLNISAANLIRNTNYALGTSYWRFGGSPTTAIEDDSVHGKVLKATWSSAGSDYRTYPAVDVNFTHTANETYSISFYAKANAANKLIVNRGGTSDQYFNLVDISTTWQRYTATLTATASGSLTFRLNAAGTLYLAKVMLVHGSKPMDWMPDPRDIASSYSSSQRVYYRTASTGSVSAPSSWITTNDSSSTGYDKWNLKALPLTLSSSVAADAVKYPYLWTCTQYKNLNGDILNSTVLLDESQTVIDGGKIITGSVDANRISVEDLSAFDATIGGFQIDSSSIHTKNVAATSNATNSIALANADFGRTVNGASRTGLRLAIGSKFGVTGDGTLYANGANLTNLVVSSFDSTEQDKILNSNIQIGGRNLLTGTGTGIGWQKSTFDATTRVFTRSTTAQSESYVTSSNIPIAFEGGQTYTLSCYYKSNGQVASMDFFKVHVSGSGSHQSKYWGVPTTEYQRGVWTFTCNAPAGTTETAYIRFDNNGSKTSGTEAILYIKDVKLEVGNTATDWTPAPEDIEGAALERTQRIYLRTTSSGAPNANTTWVTATNGGYGGTAWTLKVPPLISGTTKYPYLWSCVQTQTVTQKAAGSTCTCSTPMLDESTTVIDGGSIITNSIDANSLKTGTLEVQYFKGTEQSKILNSNIQVGGRNLFSWPVTGTKWKDEAHELAPYSNTGSFSQFHNSLLFDPFETIGEQYTISFDVKSPNGATDVKVYNSNGNPSAFYFPPVTVAQNVGDEWTHCSCTITNTAYSGGNADYSNRIEIYAPSQMGVLVRKIKVEKGNMATDWSPAPEDQTAYVDDTITEALAPIDSKTFTGIIGTIDPASQATDTIRAKNSFYFAKIHPSSYTASYYVKMRIEVTAPAAYTQVVDISLGGDNNSFRSYNAYVTRGNNVAIYYLNLYRATQAGINAGKGHALGFGLRNATNAHTVARTVRVDVLEVVNCSVAFISTPVLYENMDGAGDTNYGTGISQFTEMGIATQGQNATNNGNTYDRTLHNNPIKAAANITAAHIICGTSAGYKNIAGGVSFDLGYPILYSPNAFNANTTRSDTYSCMPSVDFQKNDTSFSGTTYSQLYLKGTVDGNTFTLSASNFMTTVPVERSDTSLPPFVYIPLGVMTSTIAGYFESSKSLYAFVNTKFRQVTPMDIVKSQTIYYRTTSSTKPVTTGISGWVGEGTSYNAWTTRVLPLKENKDDDGATKHPYLYSCEQRYRVDGTYEYSEVALDASTTVIDGGSIITNSITATQIAATTITANEIASGTITSTQIASGTITANEIASGTITATQIASGTITADRLDTNDLVARKSLTVGMLAPESQNAILNSNIQVGGRNLLLGSDDITDWPMNKTTVAGGQADPDGGTKAVLLTPSATSGWWFGDDTLALSDTSQIYTYSVWLKGSAATTCYLCARYLQDTSRYTYSNNATRQAFSITTEWKKYSITGLPLLQAQDSSTNFWLGHDATGTPIYVYHPKVEIGNQPTDWSPAPEDLAPASVQAKWGTSSSGEADKVKVVACDGFALSTGAEVMVAFSVRNTYTYSSSHTAIQLNVNGTGAKDVWVSGEVTSPSNQMRWGAGAVIAFRYDGTKFVTLDQPKVWYGECTVAAGTAAKTDTTAVTGVVICKGATVNMRMTNANTAASATLNLQGTGGIYVYAEGATLVASSALSWSAGAVVPFIFNGTAWVMDSNGARKAAAAYAQANNAAKTATDYMTFNQGTGLDIGYSGSNAKTRITTDGMTVFDGNGDNCLFAGLESSASVVRVGKSASPHMDLKTDGIHMNNGSAEVFYLGATTGVDWYGNERMGPFTLFGTEAETNTAYAGIADDTSTPSTYNNLKGDCGAYAFGVGTGICIKGNNSFVVGNGSTVTAPAGLTKGAPNVIFGNGCYIGNGRHNMLVGEELICPSGSHQLVVGQYNQTNTSGAITVGNGSKNSSTGVVTRATTFRVSAGGAVKAVSFSDSSDVRVKSDILGLDQDEATEFVKALRPVSYVKDGRGEMGFIAQEVELTGYGDRLVSQESMFGYDDFRQMSYNGFIAPLTAALQSALAKVDSLEAQNRQLLERIERLESACSKDQ